MPLFFTYVPKSALGDGTRGAGIGARTAVDAGTGVDLVVLVTLVDGGHGAGASAGAAAHAIAANHIGHWIHLQTLKLKSLYHNFLKMQC